MYKTNKNSLKCLQWNANGLKKSTLDEFRSFLRLENPDVALLSETRWSDNFDATFHNYKLFRRDRKGKRGGGVAILVHVSIQCVPFHPPSSKLIESVGVSIETQEFGKVDVISVYCPSGDAHVDDLSDAYEALFDSPQSTNFIIGGDMNAHNPLWEVGRRSNNSGSVLSSLLLDSPGVFLVTPFNIGTRRCPQSGDLSTIDLILSSSDLTVNVTVRRGPHIGSDHLPVTSVFNATPQRAKRRPPKWSFKEEKWGKWNSDFTLLLNEHNFADITDPIVAYSCFVNSLIQTSKKFFKLSSPDASKSKEPGRPWFGPECKRHVALERLAIGEWLANLCTPFFKIQLKKVRAVKKRVIRKAKDQSWEKFVVDLNPQGGHSKLWSFTKSMTGRGAPPPIDGAALRDDSDELITAPDKKASIFLDKYAAASGRLPDSDPAMENFIEEEVNSERPNPLNAKITMQELDAALSSLKKKSACGKDLIHYEMLRNLSPENRETLLFLFNSLLFSGYVPADWKHAIVIPLLKPGKDSDKADSYRPISLTSCLCKLFEKILNNRVSWHLETKNILPVTQSGFRKNRCTIDNLVHLEHTIRSGFEQKKVTYAVFLDLSKAYDVTWITGLLYKLAKIGFSGAILRWFQGYLVGRSFSVRIGDFISEPRLIFTGVPQGGILSSNFFAIMLYDFPNPSLAYCDDISSYVTANSREEAERRMQPKLNKFELWAKKWHFHFAADKCCAIAFTRKYKPPPNPVFFIFGRRIRFVKETRFLGLIFDSKLLWKSHIQSVVNKIKKCKNLFSVLTYHKFGPRISTLITLFKSIVLSRVDYGLIVYGAAAASNLEAIDVALRGILRSILGAYKSTPVELLYSELGLETIAERRKWLASKYVLTLGHKPCNAAYATASQLFHSFKKWRKWTEPCLNPTIVKLRKKGYNIFTDDINFVPVAPAPPWALRPFDVKSFPMSKRKAMSNSSQARKHFEALLIDTPIGALHVYTDGSLCPDENSTAGAFVIPELKTEEAFCFVRNTSVFSAELLSIKLALAHIYSIETFHNEIWLFTDSLSSIQALSVYSIAPKHPVVTDTLNTIRNLSSAGIRVTLVWIPSHVGIPGNERADALASAECANRLSLIKNRLSPSEQIALRHSEWRVERLDQLKTCQKPSVQSSTTTPKLTPWFFHKSRLVSTILHRLRSGHNALNEHSNRIDATHDPMCRFCLEEVENAQHLLVECPYFERKRSPLENFFRRNNLAINLESILGLNPNLQSNPQFTIRNLLAELILNSELKFIV